MLNPPPYDQTWGWIEHWSTLASAIVFTMWSVRGFIDEIKNFIEWIKKRRDKRRVKYIKQNKYDPSEF